MRRILVFALIIMLSITTATTISMGEQDVDKYEEFSPTSKVQKNPLTPPEKRNFEYSEIPTEETGGIVSDYKNITCSKSSIDIDDISIIQNNSNICVKNKSPSNLILQNKNNIQITIENTNITLLSIENSININIIGGFFNDITVQNSSSISIDHSYIDNSNKNPITSRSTTFNPTSQTCRMYYVNVNYLSLSNLNVFGGQYGVCFVNVKYSTLVTSQFGGQWVAFIDQYGKNNEFKYNSIVHSWYGVVLDDISHDIIFDNSIRYAVVAGIYSQDSTICLVKANDIRISDAGDGIVIIDSVNPSSLRYTLKQNYIQDIPDNGIVIQNVEYLDIDEYIIKNTGENGIDISYSDHIHIKGGTSSHIKTAYIGVNVEHTNFFDIWGFNEYIFNQIYDNDYAGIKLLNTTDAVIENMRIHNNTVGILCYSCTNLYIGITPVIYGNFIEFNDVGIAIDESTTVEIGCSNINNNWDTGIQIDGGSDYAVAGVNIWDSDYGIMVYDVENIKIGYYVLIVDKAIGNEISGQNVTPYGTYGLYIFNTINIMIEKLNVSYFLEGIDITVASVGEIYNSNINYCDYGIMLYYVTELAEVSFQVRTCNVTYYVHGITVLHSDFIVIHDNTLYEIYGEEITYGIYITNSNKNAINRNTIYSYCYGIALIDSWDNGVYSNNVYNCLDGYYLYYSYDNELIDNYAEECYTGIRLRNSSTNYVNSSYIYDCYYGIYLHYSSNNWILYNTLDNCYYGLYSFYSENTINNTYIECVIDEYYEP